ncbi:MAG: malto-oligosyltrehalose synthase [Gemmataceae bacterium]
MKRLVADTLEAARGRRRVPGATYRVQLHAGFTLRDAAAVVPYLHDLGVTDLYASPFLAARPGSTHGYDVIDHSRINPEVGTDGDLAALSAALKARGMGLMLDVVPNHMCVAWENPAWADVLEHGPSSPHGWSFDIAWYDSPRPGMQGRLLLPVLGEPYGQALEGGTLVPQFDGGRVWVRCNDLRLPIDPRTLGPLLTAALAAVAPETHDAVELQSLLNAVTHLPPRGEADEARAKSGLVECSSLRRRLGELAERYPDAAKAFADAVAGLNGRPGEPDSWAALDDLLERQAYRPCYWRVALDEINYRRFFDVNELAALSVEREEVFRSVHQRWLGWAADGTATGLRIDHPDGLFDPRQYFDRLQGHYLLGLARSLHQADPGRYPCMEFPRDEAELLGRFAGERHLYVVAEKILGDGEKLPAEWACDGTTGYEFINAVNGLFVDREAEGRLTEFYERFTGRDDRYADVVYQKKQLILQSSLASELNALAHDLDRIARLDRRTRDFTLNGLRRGLREVIACFPVYRSYVSAEVQPGDTRHVLEAVRKARKRDPSLGREVYDFIRDTVLLRDAPSAAAGEAYRAMQRRFAGKFQQVTSPVTAKGVEDTSFYVYNRFASLNEVGGEPGRFGRTPEELHAFLADRRGGLSPLSTHDTKRGEDVRARLNVLSEFADAWAAEVEVWAALNRPHKASLDAAVAPDANEEYLIYQTLVGVWPESGTPDQASLRDRAQAYMQKAMREAKVNSSWISPEKEYEDAVAAFLAKLLDPACSADFLETLTAFVRRVAPAGRTNSLAQTLIRCAAPGTPDTYQGTEAWDDSLVDPDNRRPVDHADLARRLVGAGPADDVKLFVTSRALRCRRDHAELFADGDYVPLPSGERVFAFQRTRGDQSAVAAVTRLNGRGGEARLTLPPGPWRDAFTGSAVGGEIDLNAGLPVALLRRGDGR